MAVDWNQIKENEEKKKLDEEKSRQQRLREKEKELIYKGFILLMTFVNII